MTTTLTDPRTEQVQRNADDIDHITCDRLGCDQRWRPGQPALCGAKLKGIDCPDEDCGHPTCPLCEVEWERHERAHERADRPWWRRWLP